ncbi:6379_t:CDS:2, partial [Cetraspora pellucida]
RQYDEMLLKIKQIHENLNIPYTRNDKIEVKKQQTASSRKESTSTSNNTEDVTIMRNNNKNDLLLDIELEERKIALKERQIKIRKETAKAQAIELQNRQLKASL